LEKLQTKNIWRVANWRLSFTPQDKTFHLNAAAARQREYNHALSVYAPGNLPKVNPLGLVFRRDPLHS